jgi:hypothetical protein
VRVRGVGDHIGNKGDEKNEIAVDLYSNEDETLSAKL